ncbi:MAG: cobalamin-dependent protein [Deltaproteobacteria bacterium]|nr:cobalamin-dependent protein [Deltaproteobacteria bacterium]
MPPVDLKKVRAYGDKSGDGAVQLSFTLPIPHDEKAPPAAAAFASRLGLKEPSVVHSADLGGYSFFIVYGKTDVEIDVESLAVPKVEMEVWDRDEIDRVIEERLGRPLVMVGACIGDDAHTVGIDAIMNMKGYHGHFGLERYRMVEAVNFGSQVPPETLLTEAIARRADAVLASQIVTGNDLHRLNLARLIELAEASGVRDRMIFVCGGPRIDHMLALELGFDAGFGRGTYAEHVASFVVQRLLKTAGA